jgi:hypothetical protein
MALVMMAKVSWKSMNRCSLMVVSAAAPTPAGSVCSRSSNGSAAHALVPTTPVGVGGPKARE